MNLLFIVATGTAKSCRQFDATTNGKAFLLSCLFSGINLTAFYRRLVAELISIAYPRKTRKS
jgi:hypothetical protein